ncbi:MAG TPA: lactate racemase domain-containing protein [Bacillota bacterium]|nr:DUF2088 domain-containing protein [Bacillota bacterium]HOA15160.1 lactate racemase domain-containing protein [Bacillota bacterium]
MEEVAIKADDIGIDSIESSLEGWLEGRTAGVRKVLLLPPDYTRSMSAAGPITAMLYRMLKDSFEVDVMPALGTHERVSDEERLKMFGLEIPAERFLVHNWRTEVADIGEVPSAFVRQASEGKLDYPIKVQVNRRLVDGTYGLIISIGQVVPHEVAGMANYTKNVLVGCGGKEMIDKTHFLGAVYGLERLMGRDHSPVRQVFDYAEERFLKGVPLQYFLTVVRQEGGRGVIKGFFAGRQRRLFEEAVALSRAYNFDLLDEPLEKVVVYLDPEHYKSTWLGNKAIYRTRMAIADRGELIVIAPGVRHFGEDPGMDKLIRKYGYKGTEYVLEAVKQNEDLRGGLSAAAHLIHGSSEGRFGITYCPGKLTREEVEGAGFGYMDLGEALRRYDIKAMKQGMNDMGAEGRVFYVANPSLGLWALSKHFEA